MHPQIRSQLLKIVAAFSLLSLGSNALAHEGHGAASLAQHALEHGYMLAPAVIIVMALLMFALKPIRSKIAQKKTD